MSTHSNEAKVRIDIDRFRQRDQVTYEKEATIGNSLWELGVYTTGSTQQPSKENTLWFYFKCNSEFYSNLWVCDATIQFSIINYKDESKSVSMDFKHHKFSRKNREIQKQFRLNWNELIDPKRGLLIGGQNLTVQFTVIVHKTTGFNMHVEETFDAPKGDITDVVLVVEGKKCYVSRQTLAMHSKFFHSLFYSNFGDSKKDEIVLEDLVHSEFVDLLNFIYPSHKEFGDKNVRHILKLADRFEVWSAMEKAEQFIGDSKHFDAVEKLILADRYNLAVLQCDAIAELKTHHSLMRIKNHEKFDELSDATVRMLFTKLVEVMETEAERESMIDYVIDVADKGLL